MQDLISSSTLWTGRPPEIRTTDTIIPTKSGRHHTIEEEHKFCDEAVGGREKSILPVSTGFLCTLTTTQNKCNCTANSIDEKKPFATLYVEPQRNSTIRPIIDVERLPQTCRSDPCHDPPSQPGFKCELISPLPPASLSENGTLHSSGTTTKINVTSPTGDGICVEVRSIHGQAQRIVINTPTTRRNCLDIYQVDINSADYFLDKSIDNLRHINSRSTEESTLADKGQQTLYGLFRPVPKPCSRYKYTATAKEDAPIDWNKGMQDSTLDTHLVFK